MHEVNGNDLLSGSDHEFVVNLYSMLLNRWPDEDGYRHHLQRCENRPEIRRQMVDEVAGSPEGREAGVVVRWPDAQAATAGEALPPGSAPVAAVVPPPGQPAASGLAGALAQLRDGLDTMDTAAIIEAQGMLTEALAALARHQATQLEARIARLEQRLG